MKRARTVYFERQKVSDLGDRHLISGSTLSFVKSRVKKLGLEIFMVLQTLDL